MRRAHEDGLPLWSEARTRMVEGLGEDRWAGLVRDLVTTGALVRE